jgi:hypothetical protein
MQQHWTLECIRCCPGSRRLCPISVDNFVGEEHAVVTSLFAEHIRGLVYDFSLLGDRSLNLEAP